MPKPKNVSAASWASIERRVHAACKRRAKYEGAGFDVNKCTYGTLVVIGKRLDRQAR